MDIIVPPVVAEFGVLREETAGAAVARRLSKAYQINNHTFANWSTIVREHGLSSCPNATKLKKDIKAASLGGTETTGYRCGCQPSSGWAQRFAQERRRTRIGRTQVGADHANRVRGNLVPADDSKTSILGLLS